MPATSKYIPNEILGHILLLACDPSAPVVLHVLKGTMTAPDSRLEIARVCRRWRAVALSLGSLWSNTLVTDGIEETRFGYLGYAGQGIFRPRNDNRVQSSAISVEGVVAVLHQWLSKSTAPLTIKWQVSSSIERRVQEACIQPLFAYTKRWKDVEMHLGFDLNSTNWPIKWFDAYPQLKRLALHHHTTRPWFYPMMIEVEHCPRLVNLTLANASLARWDMPTSTLTELTYAGNGGDARTNLEWLLANVHKLSSLTCLRVETIDLLHEFSPADSGIVRLSGLKELSLRDLDDRCTVALLRILVCPELERLSIAFPESHMSWTERIHTHFLHFIAHCSDSLQELTFDVNAHATQDVHSFLPSLPHLTSLNCPPLTSASCQLLTLRYASDGRLDSGMLPRLRSLSMLTKLRKRIVMAPVAAVNAHDPFLWRNIVDMLVSRFRPPANAVDEEDQPVQPLQKAVLYNAKSDDKGWWSREHPYELARLEALAAEGFDVEIKADPAPVGPAVIIY